MKLEILSTVYRIHKEMKRRGQGRRVGGKTVVGNTGGELWTCKTIFESVWEVFEKVWKHILENTSKSDFQSRPPTEIEMERSKDRIKTRKVGVTNKIVIHNVIIDDTN